MKYSEGLAVGLAGGLAFGLGYVISYFNLLFYPFYYGFSLNFISSPYHYDAKIWLPIWRAKQRFCSLALQDPKTAQKFVSFLRQYRPLQEKLADYINHAANAGAWLQQPLSIEGTLDPPTIENIKLMPSEAWLRQLAQLKKQLLSYSHQSQISLKKEQFQFFLNELEDLKKQTMVEGKGWRNYYLQAIEKWQEIGSEELEKLELQARTQEPITPNVYIVGEALRPGHNQSVFLGRIDLKEKFSRKVLSSQQMPMFLIQGQRRTGKTSLLNFLNPLLGSGFIVIYQDLQDACISSIRAWLEDLRKRISKHLKIPFQEWQNRDSWLENWQKMQEWLDHISKHQNYKLILAFDEYEELHNLLNEYPEQGGRLLGAMRSYSQHQNKVVFLFVGAALFSELKNPNWNEYFVQAQRFCVDYLNEEESIRLITKPVKLIYPSEISQQMFELTQGHPALLQELCEKMVEIANKEGKKDMTQADLDQVVHEIVSDRDNSTLSVFWGQFCQQPACKETVKQILNQQEIINKQQCYRLEEHRFITENNGQWQLRVPLFKKWLKRFAYRD